MSRSSWKGPYVDPKLLKKVRKLKADGKRIMVAKVWCRNSVIHPDFIDGVFGVHNGKEFISVVVTDQMVGHRLGEFADTRKNPNHAGDKKTK